MPLVTIDAERCRKDGLCVRICPKVFEQQDKRSVPEVVRQDFCNSCGHCVIVCPHGAIRHPDYPPEKIHPLRPELLPSYQQVREMVATRRSIRTFQDKPILREMIEQVIEGARFAPSAKNTQSTHFTVVQDRERLDTIARTTATWLGKAAKRLTNPVLRRLYLLKGAARDAEEVMRLIAHFERIAENMRNGTDLVLFGAPALLVFHGDKAVPFGEANANLAVQNATMIACSLGLGGFYTGYVVTAFSRDRTLPRLLGLPAKHKVYAGLTLGYPKIKFTRWLDRNPAKVTWI